MGTIEVVGVRQARRMNVWDEFIRFYEVYLSIHQN